MPERLNGPVSKTGVGATLPGVQIPLSLRHYSTKSTSRKALLILPCMNPCIKISFYRSVFASNAVFYHVALVGHPLLSSLVHKLTLFTIA